MSVAMRTVVLAVPSAHCGMCRLRILEALRLPGVDQADVDLRTREVTVVFDPGQTSAGAIVAALTGAGHPAKIAATGPQSSPNQPGASSAQRDIGEQ